MINPQTYLQHLRCYYFIDSITYILQYNDSIIRCVCVCVHVFFVWCVLSTPYFGTFFVNYPYKKSLKNINYPCEKLSI